MLGAEYVWLDRQFPKKPENLVNRLSPAAQAQLRQNGSAAEKALVQSTEAMWREEAQQRINEAEKAAASRAAIEAQAAEYTRRASELRHQRMMIDLNSKPGLEEKRLFDLGMALGDDRFHVDRFGNVTTLDPSAAVGLNLRASYDAIRQLGTSGRLKLAMERAISKGMVTGAALEKAKELVNPLGLTIFVGLLTTLTAAQGTPAAAPVDGIVTSLGVLMFGKEALAITRDLYMFVATAHAAGSELEIDRAAQYFANWLSAVVVDTAAGVVAAKGVKEAKNLGRALKPAEFAPKGSASFTNPKERAIAEYLEGLGRKVGKNPLEGVAGAGRQGDSFVDGVKHEFKTLDSGADSSTIRNVVNNSIRNGGQARNIVIDARGTGLSEAEALRGLGRAGGISRGKIDNITIIGDGFFLNKAVGK